MCSFCAHLCSMFHFQALQKTEKFRLKRVKFRCTDPLDGPDIAMGPSGIASEVPITVGEMMKLTVSKIPNKVGLCYKTGDTWNDVTFQQYYDLCIAAAKSFIKVYQIHNSIIVSNGLLIIVCSWI